MSCILRDFRRSALGSSSAVLESRLARTYSSTQAGFRAELPTRGPPRWFAYASASKVQK